MKPYYEDKWVKIFHGDCREILPSFDVKVDLVWTDPIYNVGKDYGICKDLLPDEEYLSFCVSWIASIKKLSSEIAIYVPTKYILDYWNILGVEYHQIILRWFPEGSVRYGFINQFASILTNAKPRQRTKDVWDGLQMRGMGYFFRENDFGNPGYTSEEITCKVVSSFSADESLILDPFLGSGTTCYCAKKLRRYSIGVEISEAYCEVAAKRCMQSVMEFDAENKPDDRKQEVMELGL